MNETETETARYTIHALADTEDMAPKYGLDDQGEARFATEDLAAEQTGVSNPYLSQIERGLRKPSAEILRQIAKALRIQAETLYVRAGILSDEPVTGNEVRDAISRDPKLTQEQRSALLNVYDSFTRR